MLIVYRPTNVAKDDYDVLKEKYFGLQLFISMFVLLKSGLIARMTRFYLPDNNADVQF